jgi:hypothetical protein
LNLGDPTLMGTRGLDMPVYAEPLVAQAFLAPLPQNFQPFPLSRLRHPFDMRLERAVALMGDMGVAADVYRYQQFPQRQLAMHKRKVMVGELQQLLTQQMRRLQQDEDTLEREEEQVRSRLREAQVPLRLAPHLARDWQLGEVPGDVFYRRMVNVLPAYMRPSLHSTTITTHVPPITAAAGPAIPSPEEGHPRSRRARTRPAPSPRTEPRTSNQPEGSRRNRRCHFCRSRTHRLELCSRPHRRCTPRVCHVHANQIHFEDTKADCAFWAAAGREERSPIEVTHVMSHIIRARDAEEDLLADGTGYEGSD